MTLRRPTVRPQFRQSRQFRRPRRARAARVASALVATILLAATGAVSAQTTAEEAAATLALVEDGSPLVREGAILFDHNCSACHGDTGGGLDEAKTSFPDDKRNCTRCHRPSNPPQMDHLAMNWRNAFDIGVAPQLIGPSALDGFASGAALFGYVRATMPRPWPGSLSDDEYLAITAFLAEANGAPADEVATVPDLADVRLR